MFGLICLELTVAAVAVKTVSDQFPQRQFPRDNSHSFFPQATIPMGKNCGNCRVGIVVAEIYLRTQTERRSGDSHAFHKGKNQKRPRTETKRY
jgi:hypothetical protein